MSLLEVEDLRVSYGERKDAFTAVDGVSLTLAAGSTLGLVGESGCGKSTLARAIVGLVPVTGGRLRLAGDDVTSQRRRNTTAYRKRVQMVFQDPTASLNPRMTIGQMLIEALQTGGRADGGRRAREARAAELLELVGLPSATLARYPHQFSGGQRQRIAIARALAVEPEVIITDEVTSALDVSVQASILNLLRDLQRELRLSYLFISHDLSTVKYMSDDVAVMYMGKVVEVASSEALFGAPSHPYTRALIESIPEVSMPRRHAPLAGEIPDPRYPPPGCRFHTRCPIGPLHCAGREPCLEADPGAGAAQRPHAVACHFPLVHSPTEAEPAPRQPASPLTAERGAE